MRDRAAIRQRYLQDELAVRLGGLAANLARIKSFSDRPEHQAVVESLLDESKFFIEWSAPDASLKVQAKLVELQVRLAVWQSAWAAIWANPVQRAAVAEAAGTWSDQVLEMSGLAPDKTATFVYERRLHDGYGNLLREASAYFAGQGDLYETLVNLARRLDEEGIPYAIIGGLALGRHGLVRMTQDVDVLMTADGLAAFEACCVGKEPALNEGKGYVPAFAGAHKTFRDTRTQVRIEIITAGEYPGDGKPKPVAFPNPAEASVKVDGIQVVTLEKLIELKLASGISAPHRLRDLADVQDMIVALQLPAAFAERLDKSVRDEYRRLWQMARGTEEK